MAKFPAMLSVHSLVYFLSTLRTGSLTATAQVFGVSVPTVSASIAQLESTLGYPLFLRTPGRLLPTQTAIGTEGSLRALLVGLAAIAFSRGGEVPLPEDLPAHHDLPVSLLLLSRFVAVFEAGSIGAAAARLRVTQPQISRQIANLEGLLQTRLFDRHPHGVSPNPAATALYERARPLCDVAVELVGRGNRLFAEGQQATRVGSVPPFHPESRLAGLLARLFTRWEAAAFGSPLTIESGATDQLFTALSAGALHAIIVETDAIPECYDSRVLQSAALDLVAGGAKGSLEPRHILETTPLVLQGRASGMRRMADDWLDCHGYRPTRVFEVDAMPVIGRLVCEHGYCSIAPSGVFPLSGSDVRRIPLPEAPVLVQRLVWRRDQTATRSLRRLLDLVALLAPG